LRKKKKFRTQAKINLINLFICQDEPKETCVYYKQAQQNVVQIAHMASL